MPMKEIIIVLPVYEGNVNELEQSLRIQQEYYQKELQNYKWGILLGVNGSLTSGSFEKIKKILQTFDNIKYIHTPVQGKGAGIIEGWQRSSADIRVYTDVDLAADLRSLPEMIANLEQGYDLCVGSRYHPGSQVSRSWHRRIISIIYHRFFLNFILGVCCKDGQCGLKAITARAAGEILPLVRDRGWFFESEMLFIAEKKGLKIKEIPVYWKETRQSSVNLLTTIPMFILNVFTLSLRRIRKP